MGRSRQTTPPGGKKGTNTSGRRPGPAGWFDDLKGAINWLQDTAAAAKPSGYYDQSGRPIPSGAIRTGMTVFDAYGYPFDVRWIDPATGYIDAQRWPQGVAQDLLGIGASGPTAGGSAPVMTGSVYTITLADGSVATVQDTSTGPQVIDVRPPSEPPVRYSPNAPTGYVPFYDSAGNVINYAQDPTYRPTYGGLRPVAPGYLGATDPSGAIVDFMTDPSYRPTYGGVKAVAPGWVGVYDEAGNLIGDPMLDDAYFNLSRRDHLMLSNRDFGEDVRRYDLERGDRLRQFDAQLAETIADRQQRLQELQMQIASADARSAREIAAAIERTKMELASAERLAGMDNASRERIAAQADATTRRGQTIAAQVDQRGQDVTLRGQDIDYDVARRQLAKSYLDTAAQFAGTGDPLRSALYLLGDKGSGITPQESALAQMKRIAAVSGEPAIEQFRRPAAITIAAAGGLRAVPGGRAVNILVGEEGQELTRGHVNHAGELVLDEIVPNHRLRAVTAPVHVRAAGGVTPGQLNMYTKQLLKLPASELQKYGLVVSGGRLYQRSQYRKPDGSTGYKLALANPMRVEKAAKMARRVSAASSSAAPASPRDAGTGASLSTGSSAGAATASTAATNAPEEATVRKALQESFYGPAPSEAGEDVLSGRPLWGVDLLDPKQVAYSIRYKPRAVQETMYSAWGLRNLDRDEVERRIRAVSPVAVSGPFNVTWG